jgi:thymidylate kinase
LTARSDRGRVIVVAGPDGAGKTTLVVALRRGPLRGRRTLHLHHRPHVLAARNAHDRPVTQPHGAVPWPRVLSLAKVLFLYADYVIGWAIKVRPALRRGGQVIVERGWWDLVVDPKRYRLRGVRPLTRVLARLLPRPDVTLVLTGDPESFRARKLELSDAEMRRQLKAWADVPPWLRPVHLDTTGSLEDTMRIVEGFVRAPLRHKWVGLPQRQSPRWILPATPRRAARNGLLVYTPVTPQGRRIWRGARVAAGLGALRLLPATGAPDSRITQLLDPHVPAESIPAVARSSHPGRVAVMVMEPCGRPWGLAKLAFDQAGRAALEREADAVEDLGHLLSPPLSSPRILVREPGVLIFEAVTWSPRRRPWLLSETVAFALGRFYRAGQVTEGQGPAQGDCAPWNLLSSDGRLYLVDWADARRDAPPFYDPLHFVVQAHALLGLPKQQELLDGLEGNGWVGAALTAYAAGAELSLGAASQALPTYLRLSVENLDPTREDGRRGLQARAGLLRALGGPRSSDSLA